MSTIKPQNRRRKNISGKAINSLETTSRKTIPKDRSFIDATNEFLKYCQLKALSQDTINYYEKELKQTLRALVEVDVEVDNIRKIKQSDIYKFIEHQLNLNFATSTINSRLRASRTFFKFCERKKYIDVNPCHGVEQLKERHEVGATFSKQQLKKMLDAPDITTFIGLRDLAIMLTFAHTGIRLSELTTLKINDVDFDEDVINVQYTKNRYARRIPMTKRLRSVLKTYIEERGELETKILFISVDNNPINNRSVQNRLKHYGKQTGVIKEIQVSPHVFRRTFCKIKIEAGTNLFVLQRLTGHHSLEMLKRYVAIYGKDLKDVIEDGFEDI